MITDEKILELLRKLSDQSIGLDLNPNFYCIVRNWLEENGKIIVQEIKANCNKSEKMWRVYYPWSGLSHTLYTTKLQAVIGIATNYNCPKRSTGEIWTDVLSGYIDKTTEPEKIIKTWREMFHAGIRIIPITITYEVSDDKE